MSEYPKSSSRIASATNITVGGAGGHVMLWGVVIDTGAAGTLTLQHKNSSGATIAVINTAAQGNLNFWGLRCPDGLYAANSSTGGCVLIYT